MRYLAIVIFLIFVNGCSVYQKIEYCQDRDMKAKDIKEELLNVILNDLEEMDSECNKFKKIISVRCIQDSSVNYTAEKHNDNIELKVKVKSNCKGIFYIYYFNKEFKIVNKITEMSPV